MRSVPLASLSLGLLLASCGKSEDSAAKQAGSKVGHALTDFASGVNSGIDEKLAETVELTPELQGRGLSRTTAQSKTLDDGRKGIVVYFIAKDKFAATLLARALNKEGLEIGRARAEVSFDKDDARYVTFAFEKELETSLVRKYQIDIAK